MTRAWMRMSGWARVVGTTVAALLVIVVIGPREAGGDAAVSARAIREVLDRPGSLRIDGRSLDRPTLTRFYGPRDFAPAWSPRGGGSERASRLVQALAAAETHGLEPAHYHVDAIRRRGTAAEWSAEGELLLTDAFVRYATDLRSGRRPPGFAEADWGIPAQPFDAVSALTRALGEPGTWATLLAALPPPAPEYRRLVDALRRYRAIAARGDWPSVSAGTPLRPGNDDARVPALRARLAAEEERVIRGVETRYDGQLEDSVRRFQSGRGLPADGIVGRATIESLNVSAADRVRQIALNLERWRWVPRDFGRHYIVVNVADAMLHVVRDGQTVLASRVVVGDVRHPTPVMRARMDGIILNPRWGVPTSIAVAEILPRIRENPRYLAENHMVILERRESDPFGLEIDWAAIPSDPFPFRLQQEPGPDNPLGRIKFDIPNRFDVYLHDTPNRSLFMRTARTASHGCIRVERADDLAVHVLTDGTGRWTKRRLAEAIASAGSPRITLARPLPVYILYWTAFVDPGGAVQFRDDVYGRDRRTADMLDSRGEASGPAASVRVGGCPSPEPEAAR
ncbi:MAG TPA: L,D-transpeptidase family protein [Methylomirabilota bacterium]|jgi:murein L,D-transpeptidase YcbB/YkuD